MSSTILRLVNNTTSNVEHIAGSKLSPIDVINKKPDPNLSPRELILKVYKAVT